MCRPKILESYRKPLNVESIQITMPNHPQTRRIRRRFPFSLLLLFTVTIPSSHADEALLGWDPVPADSLRVEIIVFKARALDACRAARLRAL